MVIVNGSELKTADNSSLNVLLNELGFNISLTAVELNGNIVPKKEYENTILKNGDRIEVVSFVGGG